MPHKVVDRYSSTLKYLISYFLQRYCAFAMNQVDMPMRRLVLLMKRLVCVLRNNLGLFCVMALPSTPYFI